MTRTHLRRMAEALATCDSTESRSAASIGQAVIDLLDEVERLAAASPRCPVCGDVTGVGA